MTRPAGTIDLGELPHGERPELATSWPALLRLRNRYGWRSIGRVAGAAAAVLLALLTVTAGAGPTRPVLEQHLALPAVLSYAHDQQHLYVIEAVEPDPIRIAAYRLDSGALEWATPQSIGEFGWLLRWDEVLLVHTYQDNGSVVWALDPDSGQELWRLPGNHSLDTIAGGQFVFSASQPGLTLRGDEPPVHQLTGVDPATGDPVWNAEVPGWKYAFGVLESTYLVAYGPDSDLTSYDLTTGERLASAPIQTTDSTDVHVVGSLVVLTDHSQLPPVLTAYDAVTLAPQWTYSHRDSLDVWPSGCGELVCLIGAASPRALDPASGELVWSADWASLAGGGVMVVSDLAAAGLAGHLLLTEQPRQHSWLIDAGTGQPVLDLGSWFLPQQWPEPVAAAELPLLLRSGAIATPTAAGRLRPDLSAVRLLGPIDTPLQSDCSVGTGYVFCATGPVASEDPQQLVVWRDRLA
jgi:outer membrane protein assembly factor BamB